MRTTTLGAAGPDVSAVGLGLAAVGRPAYITTGRQRDLGVRRGVAAMRHRTEALLDAAAALGVRYLDVARSYGRAEAFLARWLADHPERAETVVVGSKWGYRYTGGWHGAEGPQEVKDHSAAMFRRQWAQSRRLLGTHLDLYQIHSATPDSGVLDDRAVLAALAERRAAGLRVGVTVSGPAQADTVRRALDVIVDGVALFSTVQATWNLLEPSCAAALAEAHAAGVGVIVKEPVANGRLVAGGGDPTRLAPLRAVAARLGASDDQVALAAVLRQPWADVVLSGAATVTQLASNAAAAALDVSDTDLAALTVLAEEPGRYWRLRSERPWA